jgi:hypothetical protein
MGAIGMAASSDQERDVHWAQVIPRVPAATDAAPEDGSRSV